MATKKPKAKAESEEELDVQDDELIKETKATSRIVALEFTGIWPLLMHNPASMFFDESGGDAFEAKKIPTSEAEAAAARYVDEHDQLYIPTQALRNSIVAGGKGRRSGKVAATSVLKSGMFPAEERSLLYHAKTGKPLTGSDYEIDRRRVVLRKGSQHVAIMRSRALVRDWMCRSAFEVDVLVGDKLILLAGAISGRMVGVLDYRPERSGPFGRYKLKLVS